MPGDSRSLHRALGQRVQALRDAKGWTQEALAQSVGIEPATLSRYETAKLPFPLDVLLRVADRLGTPLSDLVRTDDVRSKPDSETSKLLLVWRRLDRSRRRLALRLLREIARP